MLCYNICRISLKQSGAVVFGAQATTAQLYLSQDTFEFGQGHMANKTPITVLFLLSENLGI